jgi:hypothetical protein
MAKHRQRFNDGIIGQDYTGRARRTNQNEAAFQGGAQVGIFRDGDFIGLSGRKYMTAHIFL